MPRQHKVEVDQSGRLSQPGPVVLAFSNDISGAAKVKKFVKDDLYRDVINCSKSRIVGELKAFSAILYLLLKPFLDQISHITIDEEYPGHGPDIRGMLLNHMRRDGFDFAKDCIEFACIGKASPAHDLARSVYKCKSKETLLVRTRDLRRIL